MRPVENEMILAEQAGAGDPGENMLMDFRYRCHSCGAEWEAERVPAVLSLPDEDGYTGWMPVKPDGDCHCGSNDVEYESEV